MSLIDEVVVYGQHIVALLAPGRRARVHQADNNAPGDVQNWGQSDLDLLIEEGRRQIDRQHDDLERIRSRAQVVLALGLALGATTASLLPDATQQGTCSASFVLWVAASVVAAWSILGAAATSVVTADMEVIHAARLSQYSAPRTSKVAADYAAMASGGENQLATRLTNLRHSVGWLLLAATLTFVTWISLPG